MEDRSKILTSIKKIKYDSLLIANIMKEMYVFLSIFIYFIVLQTNLLYQFLYYNPMNNFLFQNREPEDNTIFTIRQKLQSIMQTLQKEKYLFETSYKERLSRCQTQLQQKCLKIKELESILGQKDKTIDGLLRQKQKYKQGVHQIKSNFFKMINVVNNITQNNQESNSDLRINRLKTDLSQTKFNKLSHQIKYEPNIKTAKFDINKYFLDYKPKEERNQKLLSQLSYDKDTDPSILESNMKYNQSQSIQSYYQGIGKKKNVESKASKKENYFYQAKKEMKIAQSKRRQVKNIMNLKDCKLLYGSDTY